MYFFSFRLYFFIMKKLVLFITTIFLLSNVNAFSVEEDRSLLEKLFNKDLPGGSASKKEKKEAKSAAIQNINKKCSKIDDRSLLEKVFRTDLPGGSGKKEKCINIY